MRASTESKLRSSVTELVIEDYADGSTTNLDDASLEDFRRIISCRRTSFPTKRGTPSVAGLTPDDTPV